jgi:hypothetical protein
MRKLACWNMIWKKKKILRTNKKKYTFSELTVYAQKRGFKGCCGQVSSWQQKRTQRSFSIFTEYKYEKKAL